MRRFPSRALLSSIPLIVSAFLALSTLLYSSLPLNLAFLLTSLSLSLFFCGLYGLLVSNQHYMTASIGGQLVWSCCSLALQEASLLLVWTMLFVQLLLLLLGLKGMWIFTFSRKNISGRIWRTVAQSLLVSLEWLGAAAIFSTAILLTVPLFRTDIGLLLLAALLIVALISFAFLATRVISSHSGPEEAPPEKLK